MELLEGLLSLLEDERTPLLSSAFQEPGGSATGRTGAGRSGGGGNNDESFSGFEAGQPGSNYSSLPTFDWGDSAAPMWYNAAGDTAIVRGLVPCTNCCIGVPQDRWVTVEQFGKYEKVLEPGLQFAGPDLLGCCVQFRSISKRVLQQESTVSSITKDKLSVTVHVAVQRSVAPENVGMAVYAVTDLGKQVDAAVADIVRSLVPQHTLEEFFAMSEELSTSIRVPLVEQLGEYGLHVHRVNVTDIQPASDIVDAMNNVAAQKNHLESSILEADAAKICTCRRAEAEAAALELQGRGTARLRGAIVSGYSRAFEDLSQPLTVELLLMSEYTEMLKSLTSGDGDTHTIFLKRSGADDTKQSEGNASKRSPTRPRLS